AGDGPRRRAGARQLRRGDRRPAGGGGVPRRRGGSMSGSGRGAGSALRVEGLRAGYGKITVLWDVDLHVDEGELVTIIGANGAGKTTLLRAISGLVPVRAGSVTAFGARRLAGLSPARIVRSQVGHVPEGRQLFPLMTVKENLESGAEYLQH